MKIEELLSRKHDTYLSWVSPRPAVDKNGNVVDASVKCTATVKDCVNLARNRCFRYGVLIDISDEELLGEFIDINWAGVDTEPPSHK